MDTLGRYRILGELGRGAMGIVYRAHDLSLGREIAIKTIRLSDLADADERGRVRERLFREARSAGMLSHPNIVTIYDVAEQGDIAYIAMERVEGPTLARLLATDPPDGTAVLSILSQTAAALDYAHKRGIVHRDVKPGNIMIHDGNTAKITDFGVARIQSHQVTQAGSMVGTPNYMSPEQIQGQEVDGRSDQFSLAVIAYELLTGEKPFSAESIPALALRIVQEEPVPLQRLNPSLDWPVDTVMQRGLAKKAGDRYPTCADFVFALENACRACRKWKPLPVGAAHAMETISEPPARVEPVVAPIPVPFAHLPVRTEDVQADESYDYPEPSDAPPPLRFIRRLTVFLVAAGLLAAAIIWGLRSLEERRELAADAPRSPATSDAKGNEAPSNRGALKVAPSEERDPRTAVTSPLPSEPLLQRPQPGFVNARLITNPPGALLVVDGAEESACTSPCSLSLRQGRHTLAATKDGYRRTLRILETPIESEIYVNLEPTSGTVMIRTEPRNATIIVNGETRPEKTPTMLKLPAGRYKIELVLDDDREQNEVVVRDSAITNLAVTFGAR